MEIRPQCGWFNIDLAELWRYRDLIFLFVRRDFVAVYKQTILGPIWFLIQPLFTTIVFTVIFSNIAKIPTDGLPPMLFYMSGTVCWAYFASCMTQTSNTFISNAGIFGKVYFPRLVVPISVVITNLLTFFIQFGMFLAFILYFFLVGAPIHPTVWVLLTPFLLVQMATLGLGMGILISSMTTKYRDLAMALGFGVQLWMYATPIVYPLSQIPLKWQWLFAFNPMTAIIETFRYAFLGSGAIQPWMLILSAGVTVLILIVGIMFFSRVEKTFMDTV
ncbi:MAG: ABC transporter permease [Methanospirillaceae archaeon]|nr:ABC transporter permease [Methanospirillaceae archaeon]